MKRFVCILLFIISLGNYRAQENSIQLTLDTNSIRIGEKANLEIKITFPVTNKIIFTEPKDSIASNVEILNKLKTDTSFSDDLSLKTLYYHYSITSFDSGYHVIPPFTFVSNTDTIESNPLLLTVNTVEVDTSADIKDIKEVYRYPFNLWDWLENNKYYLLGITAILAIVFFIINYWKKIKPQPKITVEPEITIPAHITALEKLNKIKEQKLWQEGHVKTYYSEITDVIRIYIEQVFKMEAMEQTTDETLSLLRLKIANEQTKNKLKQILILADMVKFAKEKPTPAENENSMQLAIDFINETTFLENITNTTGK
ncbi:MAG: hypothetical protein HND27_00895 [Bacteroidetes bacterium]|nr:hypothetical protein [Bacteroidota bacterium]MBV6461975.1 hypothetical protein [Flavobacteriales bacterium]WKZ76631.1 MAG: hypothetical protein QY303_06940 [Vicingaceae bacterium]MCL4815548.1 hypothetical protein [Flavobacteriales bacterium]NOG94313.1 hypothetical protein [Bacteroidota bacterium]